MRARALLVALAAASALLVLCGCVAPVSKPTPPSAAEIDAYNQHQLDETWKLEGLQGAIPRQKTSTVLPKSDNAWSTAIFDCLSDSGYPDMAIGGGLQGFTVAQSEVSVVASDDQKAALYNCMADHPQNPVQAGVLYSASQLHYLWKYYTTWQIPCLRVHGYTLSRQPTRTRFLSNTGRPWTPFDAVDIERGEASLTDNVDRQLHELELLCGPKYGVIASSG